MESRRWVGDFSVGGGKGREVAVDGFALWRQFMQFLGLEIHIVGTETELLAPLYVSSAGYSSLSVCVAYRDLVFVVFFLKTYVERISKDSGNNYRK